MPFVVVVVVTLVFSPASVVELLQKEGQHGGGYGQPQTDRLEPLPVHAEAAGGGGPVALAVGGLLLSGGGGGGGKKGGGGLIKGGVMEAGVGPKLY